MVLSKPEMVLLDIDGTLVDTVPDLAFSIDTMLEEIGVKTHGVEKIRDWVGNGIERLVHRALTDDNDGEAEDELFDKAFPIFMDIYADNTATASEFYPGVEEGLKYLKSKNFKLGCVTNKRTRFTETLLKSLGVYNDFEIVICGDTLPKCKPDPIQLLHAAEFFNVEPNNSLMVGDSTNDVYAAKAAGFQSLAVDYGYNCGIDIRESSPDLVIDSLAKLPELI